MFDRHKVVPALEGDHPLGPEISRAARDRWIAVTLTSVLVGALALYLVATFSEANTARERLASDRNENTARLCAQLLDEQFESAFSVLKALAQRPVFQAPYNTASSQGRVRALQDAVELVPDLMAAAVYRADGSLVEQYPQSAMLQTKVSQEPWFVRFSSAGKHAPYINDTVRLPDTDHTEAFTVAVPLDLNEIGHPAGYLLVFFRLGDIYDWLRSVHVSGGVVLLVDSNGRIMAKSGDAVLNYGTSTNLPFRARNSNQKQALPLNFPPLEKALSGNHGSGLFVAQFTREGETPGGEQPILVGYAAATRPQWNVLVVQPTESAFAPSQYLLRRFAIVGIPSLLILPFIGGTLVHLYGRQLRLAATLAERNAMLHRANQIKSDVLANVSHDLKTPIAGMQLSVSGLLDTSQNEGGWNPRHVEECLHLVSEELDHLAARVRNLLDMSRLDADAAPLLREPCDLADIAAGALERVRPLTQGRVVDARFPQDPLLVDCDQAQMETVVLNLLENALRYTPPGSPLWLEGEIQGTDAVLKIRDQGPGLPPGSPTKLFEKFHRVGTNYGRGGTGLGLAICAAIMEAHGGQIEAHSHPSGGAEFIITIPLLGETDFMPEIPMVLENSGRATERARLYREFQGPEETR